MIVITENRITESDKRAGSFDVDYWGIKVTYLDSIQGVLHDYCN